MLETIKTHHKTQKIPRYYQNPGEHDALGGEINSRKSISNKDDLRTIGHIDEITGSDDKQGSTCSI